MAAMRFRDEVFATPMHSTAPKVTGVPYHEWWNKGLHKYKFDDYLCVIAPNAKTAIKRYRKKYGEFTKIVEVQPYTNEELPLDV